MDGTVQDLAKLNLEKLREELEGWEWENHGEFKEIADRLCVEGAMTALTALHEDFLESGAIWSFGYDEDANLVFGHSSFDLFLLWFDFSQVIRGTLCSDDCDIESRAAVAAHLRALASEIEESISKENARSHG